MKSLPERIDCLAEEAGKPIGGLMLIAQFNTVRKNPYALIFGPTDQNGRACLDRATIVHSAQVTMELALMDYYPLENSFTGIASVKIMQEDDLQNALRAHEIYEAVAEYPVQYKKDLEEALAAIRRVDWKKIQLRIQIAPPSADIVLE